MLNTCTCRNILTITISWRSFPSKVDDMFIVRRRKVKFPLPVLRVGSLCEYMCVQACAWYSLSIYRMQLVQIRCSSNTLPQVQGTHCMNYFVYYECILHFSKCYVFPSVTLSLCTPSKNITGSYCKAKYYFASAMSHVMLRVKFPIGGSYRPLSTYWNWGWYVSLI